MQLHGFFTESVLTPYTTGITTVWVVQVCDKLQMTGVHNHTFMR